MDDGPYWVILLKYGSHDMRHIGFRRLTVVNGTPGFWGVTPTIDIMCGLPSDVYQLGHLRRLIYLVWTTLRSLLLFLDNPPKPFFLELPHARTPISLGCPSAYEMHCDAISITHITHANISPCIYSYNLNHTIMLCNFTFPHSKN